jgi:hypothetical protein
MPKARKIRAPASIKGLIQVVDRMMIPLLPQMAVRPHLLVILAKRETAKSRQITNQVFHRPKELIRLEIR